MSNIQELFSVNWYIYIRTEYRSTVKSLILSII